MENQYTTENQLWSPAFARVLLSCALWAIAFATFYLLPIYLEKEHSADASEIGFYVGVLSLAAMLCTPLLGYLGMRIASVYIFAVGSLLMAGASLAFIFVDQLGSYLVLLRVVQGLSYAAILTCSGAMVSRVVDDRRLGQAFALSGGSMMAMNAIFPPIVEQAYQRFGWQSVFGFASVCALSASIVVLSITKLDSRFLSPRQVIVSYLFLHFYAVAWVELMQ